MLARIALAAALAAAATGCAPKRFAAPPGPGAPVAAYAAEWQRIAGPCLAVRTLTAELGLSGRVGSTRLRGRVQAGLAGGSIRLEGVAPFGQPVFILAGGPAGATLLLPRDDRVVRAADASEILDALVGVRLDAGALRDVLTGCATAAAPTAATMHGEITRFVVPDGAVYVRRRGATARIVAGEIRSFLVEYPDAFTVAGSVRPGRVRISRGAAGADRVDLTIELSQIETNVDLPDAAFTIDVPLGADPMTIEELRRSGPLGGGD